MAPWGGFFFQLCSRHDIAISYYRYYPHISHHTLVYSSVESYVTDCYARNVLYHSTHVRHQGLASSDDKRAEYRCLYIVTLAVLV